MKQRIQMAFTAFCIVILLIGCTKKVDDEGMEPAATPEENEVEVASDEEKIDEEDEIEISKPAEDLGAMEIELTGTASIDGKVLKVEGQTNLLEGSKLTLKLDWAEGTLIGEAIEAYGENGEKMTGELVETEGDGQRAIVRVKERKE